LIDTLQRSKEKEYETLTGTSLDGFWIADSTGRILDINETLRKMLGYTREKLLTLSVTDIEAAESPEQVTTHLQSVIETGSDRFQSRYRRSDGTIIDVEVSAQNVKELNGRFFVFVRDITGRKLAEEEKSKLEIQLQQAQKMESVGRLAGGVAHDFNNMLSVIIGHAGLAIIGLDPASPVHAHLTEISKAAERSADLTRQLLAFARKQTIAPRLLDLNEVVSGMLKMLQRLIGEDINLTWKPSSSPWPVKVDPSQIDQLLANLCINARDAISDVGTITIETENSVIDKSYSAHLADVAPGEYVRLSVSDDGFGMDRETLTHIFEPFFTTKEIGKGTGLGLATVYGIVKQNNGFINVYSEQGLGTTFTIYLPRQTGKPGQVPAEEVPEPLLCGQETILLVEDDPAILDMVRSILTIQGYRVLPANTTGEAIRLAGEHAGEIQLLMTDVIMPGMNGKDLANKLQLRHPQIKCLFMSGYTSNVIAHHGVLDEEVHFIQKPFTLTRLAAKLREVLDGR
jgi:PAS domain S-box-containing protein